MSVFTYGFLKNLVATDHVSPGQLCLLIVVARIFFGRRKRRIAEMPLTRATVAGKRVLNRVRKYLQANKSECQSSDNCDFQVAMSQFNAER